MSNGGDAAIFQAASRVLRQAFGPATEFIVQDDHPQRIRTLYPDLNVVGSCYWNLIYTELQGCAGSLVQTVEIGSLRFGAVVNTPRSFRPGEKTAERAGTRLFERLSFRRHRRRHRRNVSRRELRLRSAPLRYVDRDRVGPTASRYLPSPPVHSPVWRIADEPRRIFRAARLIFLRDKRSYAHVLDMKVPKDRLRIAPDAAFALADPDLAERPIDSVPLSKPHPASPYP